MLLQEAELDLWLRPYEVLVTSNRTALIELIPDSLSIHTIKAKSPPGTSVVDHFHAMYIEVWSCSLLQMQPCLYVHGSMAFAA